MKLMLDPRRPRTPKKFFCARRLAEKVGGHGRANPWIISLFYRKPLILEKSGATDEYLFSTCLHRFSTLCTVFYTDGFSRLVLTFSLYLIEKKEEEGTEREKERGTPIHGLGVLPIFSSTGCGWLPRVFRGNSWTIVLAKTIAYMVCCCHPRIHVEKCLGVSWSCHA